MYRPTCQKLCQLVDSKVVAMKNGADFWPNTTLSWNTAETTSIILFLMKSKMYKRWNPLSYGMYCGMYIVDRFNRLDQFEHACTCKFVFQFTTITWEMSIPLNYSICDRRNFMELLNAIGHFKKITSQLIFRWILCDATCSACWKLTLLHIDDIWNKASTGFRTSRMWL